MNIRVPESFTDEQVAGFIKLYEEKENDTMTYDEAVQNMSMIRDLLVIVIKDEIEKKKL